MAAARTVRLVCGCHGGGEPAGRSHCGNQGAGGTGLGGVESRSSRAPIASRHADGGELSPQFEPRREIGLRCRARRVAPHNGSRHQHGDGRRRRGGRRSLAADRDTAPRADRRGDPAGSDRLAGDRADAQPFPSPRPGRIDSDAPGPGRSPRRPGRSAIGLGSRFVVGLTDAELPRPRMEYRVLDRSRPTDRPGRRRLSGASATPSNSTAEPSTSPSRHSSVDRGRDGTWPSTVDRPSLHVAAMGRPAPLGRRHCSRRHRRTDASPSIRAERAARSSPTFASKAPWEASHQAGPGKRASAAKARARVGAGLGAKGECGGGVWGGGGDSGAEAGGKAGGEGRAGQSKVIRLGL